ncbi:MAG: Yip1 family protein [Terracidiphilus sp.]|nr:Yip1 family protein [Terracidiphilus sp.]
MSNLETDSPAPQVQGLTQLQRVTSIFTAPSKTFDDIKGGNRSWWLPYLLAIAFGYLLFFGITAKVGWQQVAENNMKMNPKQAERIDQMPADQRASAMKLSATITQGIAAAVPVTLILVALVVALILWPTINFGFGGKATYGQILAVYFYAGLPALIQPVLGTAALYAGLAPESFNINNFAGTNIAYYLSIDETNKALYALASQFDIVTIWVAILLAKGIATVAGKKPSAGYITIFGWWGVWTVLRVVGGLLAG